MLRKAMIDYKTIVKHFFAVAILLTAVCSMYYLGYHDGWDDAPKSFSITVQTEGKIIEKKKDNTQPKSKKRYPKPKTVIRRHFNS